MMCFVRFQGNIRVFCRVRPLLGEEVIAHNDVIPHMNFPDAEEQKILEIEKLSEANLNEVSIFFLKEVSYATYVFPSMY